MEFFFVTSGHLLMKTFASRLSQEFAGLKSFAMRRAESLPMSVYLNQMSQTFFQKK
jgi:hypothetical protein